MLEEISRRIQLVDEVQITKYDNIELKTMRDVLLMGTADLLKAIF